MSDTTFAQLAFFLTIGVTLAIASACVAIGRWRR